METSVDLEAAASVSEQEYLVSSGWSDELRPRSTHCRPMGFDIDDD